MILYSVVIGGTQGSSKINCQNGQAYITVWQGSGCSSSNSASQLYPTDSDENIDIECSGNTCDYAVVRMYASTAC